MSTREKSMIECELLVVNDKLEESLKTITELNKENSILKIENSKLKEQVTLLEAQRDIWNQQQQQLDRLSPSPPPLYDSNGKKVIASRFPSSSQSNPSQVFVDEAAAKKKKRLSFGLFMGGKKESKEDVASTIVHPLQSSTPPVSSPREKDNALFRLYRSRPRSETLAVAEQSTMSGPTSPKDKGAIMYAVTTSQLSSDQKEPATISLNEQQQTLQQPELPPQFPSPSHVYSSSATKSPILFDASKTPECKTQSPGTTTPTSARHGTSNSLPVVPPVQIGSPLPLGTPPVSVTPQKPERPSQLRKEAATVNVIETSKSPEAPRKLSADVRGGSTLGIGRTPQGRVPDTVIPSLQAAEKEITSHLTILSAKLEKTTKEFETCKTLEDLAVIKDSLYPVVSLWKCLEPIPLPTGDRFVPPAIRVNAEDKLTAEELSELKKFGQLKMKMARVLWTSKKKVQFLIQLRTKFSFLETSNLLFTARQSMLALLKDPVMISLTEDPIGDDPEEPEICI